ncbi:hypothetical protein [Xanthomonas sp. WHRI 7945]|nr:hypothetical protein [Xanthomonas campestris pv. campestris]
MKAHERKIWWNGLQIFGGIACAPVLMRLLSGGPGREYSWLDVFNFFLAINFAIIAGGLPLIAWERRNIDSERSGFLGVFGGFVVKVHMFFLFSLGYFIGSLISFPFMKFDPVFLWIPGAMLSGCFILVILSKRWYG